MRTKMMAVCHYFFNRNTYYLFFQVRKKFGRLNPGQICQVLAEHKNENDFLLKILKIYFWSSQITSAWRNPPHDELLLTVFLSFHLSS